MTDAPPDELQRTQHERDLYRALLDLGIHDELNPFLEKALALLVAATGARQGYLEIRDESPEEGESTWSIGHSCTPEEIAGIRGSISRGIISEALATGCSILTNSALVDERFHDRESVRARQIDAVICAPIAGNPSLGVVYLQGRTAPGYFSEEDRRWAELLARHLAPLADRLVARERAGSALDATRELRRRHRLDGFIGRSAAIAQALEQAMLVAPLDVNVLLLGPSGTGKSQLARTIHDNSARRAGPFVDLNCAALPESLVESELFGALAGSHSEARRDALGKIAAAERGTLFLDEIGEVPIGVQAKLLQLLQSKQYYPLGSSMPVRADVRLIAATNVDLEEAVRLRRFREDLFYRLQVLPIRLPSLAERREDVTILAHYLTALVCRRNNLPQLVLGRSALFALRATEWPGNVRQLEHAIEAAAIRATGERADQIVAQHLFPHAPQRSEAPARRSFQEATRAFQRDLLKETLEETDWNVTETARRLELARSHVYNLIGTFSLGKEA